MRTKVFYRPESTVFWAHNTQDSHQPTVDRHTPLAMALFGGLRVTLEACGAIRRHWQPLT